jgi:hypothetical protein
LASNQNLKLLLNLKLYFSHLLTFRNVLVTGFQVQDSAVLPEATFSILTSLLRSLNKLLKMFSLKILTWQQQQQIPIMSTRYTRSKRHRYFFCPSSFRKKRKNRSFYYSLDNFHGSYALNGQKINSKEMECNFYHCLLTCLNIYFITLRY